MAAVRKIALITGVSREEGLGFAIATRMAQAGFDVILTARDITKAKALAQKINTGDNLVFPLALDIKNETMASELTQLIGQSFGGLDILINNAGGGFDAGVAPLETDLIAAHEAFEINLFGPWRMMQLCVPLLQMRSGARIINVSSGAGTFSDDVYGMARHPALVPSYALSKLALNGLTVKMSAQLKPLSIDVNAVDPGLVATYPGMKEMGAIAPSAAAEDIFWLVNLPAGNTGKLFKERKETGW